MTLSGKKRRWQRHPIDVPVQVIVHDGPSRIVVPGRGTEISAGGMALCAGIPMQPNDVMEVEFQAPCSAQVAGVIRNRTGYSYGLEFLSPLPIFDANSGKEEGEVEEGEGFHPSRPGASPVALFVRRHFTFLRERALEISRVRKEIERLHRVIPTLHK